MVIDAKLKNILVTKYDKECFGSYKKSNKECASCNLYNKCLRYVKNKVYIKSFCVPLVDTIVYNTKSKYENAINIILNKENAIKRKIHIGWFLCCCVALICMYMAIK